MQGNNKKGTVKAIACCAMLAALSIVLARLLCFATPDGVRWSLDKFPIFLAGLLFGPLMGVLTGFTADFLGSLMQFGFNPLLCLPALLYGLFGGVFRKYLHKNVSVFRLAVSYLCPILFGSILYQSYMLAYIYFDGGLVEGFLYYLGTRTVQFTLLWVAEVTVIYMLMKLKVFNRLGVWPPYQK